MNIINNKGLHTPPWQIRDVIYIFLIIVIATFAITIASLVLNLSVFFEGSSYQSLIMLGVYLLQSLIIFIPLYFFTFVKYKSSIRDFGFNRINIFTSLGAAVLAYLGYLGLNYVILRISQIVGQGLPGFGEQQPILPLFGDDRYSVIIAIVVIVVIAPIIEEMFFRGYILQTLLKKNTAFSASIITALIFAVVHFDFQSIIPIFILGLILNWLFLKFKSIWPSIFFHVLNNLITLLILIFLPNLSSM